MKLPKLRRTQQTVQTQSVFLGYNHNPRIGDGEFYDMCNLSSDSYPLLSPRSRRGVLALTDGLSGSIRGMAVNNGLCYVKGSSIVLPGGRAVELGLTDGSKHLVTMGAYVIILPDKKWINTAEPEQYGQIECEYTASRMDFWTCHRDGTPFRLSAMQDKPVFPMDGDYWLDSSGQSPVLKRWDDDSGLWNEELGYLRLHFEDGPDFREGDALVGPEMRTVYTAPEGVEQFLYIPKDPVILEVVEGDPVIVGYATYGMSVNSCRVEAPVCWKRAMPDMDYVIESGNRLWGCKFGRTAAGFVNEIYASGLGDFRRWNNFQGISTDSYRASVGADGPFTGAVNYMGRPLFFKEDRLLRIYGDQPSNFRVQDTTCQGVQRGCAGSLAVVDNTLFYKAWTGVCAYDGSVPVPVGKALGSLTCSEAVAGSLGQKYYLSMTTDRGKQLYVYDVGKGLWHREDDPGAVCFATGENALYCLRSTGDQILLMTGGGEPAEQTVTWMAQTGPLGLTTPEAKYISRLLLRLSVEPEAMVMVSVSYGEQTGWEHLYTLKGSHLRSFTLPIRPKRCDHMYLRLSGSGQMQLYSMTRVWEEGSEV